MKKIGATEVRYILTEILEQYEGLCEMAMRTPDEQFLKMNLCDDFGFDPLDVDNMFVTLFNLYNIVVDAHNHLTEFSFYKEKTVENFIDMVNYCLKQEK